MEKSKMNIFPLIDYKHECFQEYEDECSLVLWNWICSMGCSWCSLKNILNKKDKILDVDYLDLIKNHKKIETAVVFLGGEPLNNFQGVKGGCQLAKELGLKTKVFTNGYYKEGTLYLIKKGLLDAVSIDLKCPMDQKSYIRNIVKINEYYKYGAKIEFRTTIHPNLSLEDKNLIDGQIKLLFRDTDILNNNGHVTHKFKHIFQRYIIPPKGD